MNQNAVQIMAEPITAASCRFTVDRPVLAESSYHFASSDQAENSPLAKRLFALDGVASVLIFHDQITVSKKGEGEWPPLAKQIGSEIRAHVESGDEALDASLLQDLPPAEEIRLQVEKILEEQINPAVAAHGGVVRLIDVKDNNVFIQMGGGCQGCGMANVTLKHGVETAIRQAVPAVGAILDTTDHGAGQNPYYAPTGH